MHINLVDHLLYLLTSIRAV